MSHSPVTVAPEAPIEEVARILVENGIHRVPVVDDQEVLAGIITTIELVRLLAERRIGVIALKRSLLVVAALLWLAAVVACDATLAARVREHTYPPTFRYFTKAELKTTMWQLAALVSQLDYAMRAAEGAPEAKRAEGERILTEMHEVTRALGPGGWPSNHPVVSRNVERFRLDLRAARRALQLDPPSFYLAGSISGACLHCHGDD